MTVQNGRSVDNLAKEFSSFLRDITKSCEVLSYANRGIFNRFSWASVAGKADGARVWYNRAVFSTCAPEDRITMLHNARKGIIIVREKAKKEMVNNTRFQDVSGDLYKKTGVAIATIESLINNCKDI
ncbi:hypothetical protein NQF86_04430 [Bombella sp. TMW 2.2543]|uniref:Uncharacterized protein n=1 Tax=Bombella pluederhausensis TaxID=2967336 RepID=A0ABT3WGB0_9PROT|nr:hypothetical protein [Bombella pluederhausensis]MCX5617918.1 hypothetical protein [Bombella pluederhausensis]